MKNNLREKAFQYILEVSLPKLQSKGINLHLDFENNYVSTHDGIKCSGYFDEKRKILGVAVGTKKLEDWFTTFLHEVSHFEQYLENCEAWRNSQYGELNSDELLDRFLKGEKIDNIEQVIKNVCFLEYDCEKRTTEKLKLMPGFIDIDFYVQKSNAYVAYYKQMFDRVKWYNPEKAPYLNESIFLNMPKEFIDFKNYFDNYSFNEIDWESCF